MAEIYMDLPLKLSASKPDKESLSDEVLASSSASGSSSDFEVLIRRYSSAIYRLAYRMTGDHYSAEDITQETFIKTFKALPKSRLDLPFKPWLYRIATNTALTFLKKRRPNDELNETHKKQDDHSKPIDDKLDIQNALKRLPLNYRQVVILRTAESLSYYEIAQIIQINESTARTWFRRAKNLLKTYL